MTGANDGEAIVFFLRMMMSFLGGLGLLLGFAFTGPVAAHQGCVAIPSDLISWWDGDNVTGATAFDNQGANNGTIVGSTTAPGIVKRAFSFDGDGDYITSSTNDFPSGNSPITYSLWIKPGNNPGTDHRLIEYGGYSAGQNFNLYIANNKYRLDYWNFQYYDFSDTIIGEWQYIVLLSDGAQHKFYLNGELMGSDNKVLNLTNSGSLTIGRFVGGGFEFTGLLDEIQVFNRVLTEDEILAEYNAGSAGKCKNGAAFLDHFACYWAWPAKGEPRHGPREVVTLSDQFDDSTKLVAKPIMMCNPTNKNNDGISNQEDHLTCYAVKDLEGGKHWWKRWRESRLVSVDNQFGDGQLLKVAGMRMLCVPSKKQFPVIE